MQLKVFKTGAPVAHPSRFAGIDAFVGLGCSPATQKTSRPNKPREYHVAHRAAWRKVYFSRVDRQLAYKQTEPKPTPGDDKPAQGPDEQGRNKARSGAVTNSLVLEGAAYCGPWHLSSRFTRFLGKNHRTHARPNRLQYRIASAQPPCVSPPNCDALETRGLLESHLRVCSLDEK